MAHNPLAREVAESGFVPASIPRKWQRHSVRCLGLSSVCLHFPAFIGSFGVGFSLCHPAAKSSSPKLR
eukprot:9339064-Alexandrium_andersonii.AAC.1